MSSKWSASRVGTFVTCKLRYKYQYIDKWISSDTSGVDVQNKGLAFHETAEQYHTGMTDDEAKQVLEGKIKEYNVDESVYNEHAALERFLLFWKNNVAPKELEGYVVKKETWANDTIDEEPFCGALDLELDRPDSVIIFDYKTAQTASTAKYKNQLVLYAYMVGHTRGWTPEEIAQNIKLFVFFPFSKQPEDSPIEDKAQKSLKELKFTPADVNIVIQAYFIQHIRESKLVPWDQLSENDGKYSFITCGWCPYCGSIPDPKTGFKGCKVSYDAGKFQKRGVTFTKKED
jgi:RecB family exonuclease